MRLWKVISTFVVVLLFVGIVTFGLTKFNKAGIDTSNKRYESFAVEYANESSVEQVEETDRISVEQVEETDSGYVEETEDDLEDTYTLAEGFNSPSEDVESLIDNLKTQDPDEMDSMLEAQLHDLIMIASEKYPELHDVLGYFYPIDFTYVEGVGLDVTVVGSEARLIVHFDSNFKPTGYDAIKE